MHICVIKYTHGSNYANIEAKNFIDTSGLYIYISQEFSMLQAADQLQAERAAGNVFQGFHEGEIQFPPTYKYGSFPK